MGFTCAPPVTRKAVVSYTALPPLPRNLGGSFLLHYPWSRLHRTLSGILPCEARTFLVWHLSACQPRSFILLISKRVYFTTHLLVLSRRSFHKAATKKNVPWHILAPSAVACDMFLFRASAHPAERFLCHRTKFPMTQKRSISAPPSMFSTIHLSRIR